MKQQIEKLESIVAAMREIHETIPLKRGVWRLFNSWSHGKWQHLLEEILKRGVHVLNLPEPSAFKPILNIKGERTAVTRMKKKVLELEASVAIRSVPIALPIGTAMRYFYEDPSGQAELKRTETEYKTCIELIGSELEQADEFNPLMPNAHVDSDSKVAMYVYGENDHAVERAEKTLLSIIDTIIINEEIIEHSISELPPTALNQLEEFARKLGIDIDIENDPAIHSIKLHGYKSDVLLVKDEVRDVLARMCISKPVKWMRQLESEDQEEYDPVLSIKIEMAYQQDKKDSYCHNEDGENFTIDFLSMVETNLDTKEKAKVIRVDFTKDELEASEEPELMYKKMNINLMKQVDSLESQIKSLKSQLKTSQTVDVGVQFNYVALERDYIQNVTISQSKLFTVRGDQQHSFIWDGYGFELSIPKGACPPEEECDILVDVAVGGDFVFPKGVEPVSAIYIISRSNPSKPNQPLSLRLQHCVDLTNGHTQLCFYRALLNEPTPPYHFKPVKEKGVFDIGSQYGELQLPVFCGMAIGTTGSRDEQESGNDDIPDTSVGGSDADQNESSHDTSDTSGIVSDASLAIPMEVNRDIMFFGKMLYLRNSDELNHWQVKFIVVKDIDALKNCIARELHDHEKDAELSFKFTDQSIELNFNPDNKDYPGWTVEPHVEPSVIEYSRAFSFGYSRMSIPPTCFIDVYGDVTIEGCMKRLNYPLLLNGAMIKEDLVPKVYIKRTIRQANTREGTADAYPITEDERDYLKVYDSFIATLVEVVTSPRILARKLKDADLIASTVERDIVEMIPGVSNEHNANLLVREVRKVIVVCRYDRSKQRQKLILFCRVLSNSEDPALSILASEISKTAGIPTVALQ